MPTNRNAITIGQKWMEPAITPIWTNKTKPNENACNRFPCILCNDASKRNSDTSALCVPLCDMGIDVSVKAFGR
jgi:hypothetical protein